MGLLTYFLGIDLSNMPNGDMLLTQRKYINQLLVKGCIEYANSITYSMSTSTTRSSFMGDLYEHLTIYRSQV